MSSNLLERIARLEAQEVALRFPDFTHEAAWNLGNQLTGAATERKLSVTVDITMGDQQVFHSALPGTTADNDWWIARKIRSVRRFGESSFLIGQRHEAAGTDFNDETGLNFSEYVAHGGCFPIRLISGVLVGTVTVSGLPQEEDHALVVEALTVFLC
ncbi:MAG: heme-degrading domain-containing protein [Microbacteriaceae bacterium]